MSPLMKASSSLLDAVDAYNDAALAQVICLAQQESPNPAVCS
jgi:hypothetical protein